MVRLNVFDAAVELVLEYYTFHDVEQCLQAIVDDHPSDAMTAVTVELDMLEHAQDLNNTAHLQSCVEMRQSPRKRPRVSYEHYRPTTSGRSKRGKR